jgi:hypothetical protein
VESGVHALLSRIAKAEHTSGGKALVAEESTIAAEDSVAAASHPVSNRAGRPDRPQRLHQSRCQRRQSCGRIDPASTGATAISRPAAACAGVAIP